MKFPSSHVQAVAEFGQKEHMIHLQAAAKWNHGTERSSSVEPWRRSINSGRVPATSALSTSSFFIEKMQHQGDLLLHSSWTFFFFGRIRFAPAYACAKLCFLVQLIKYMWLQWMWTGRSKANNICLDVKLFLLSNALCVVSDWLRNVKGARLFIHNRKDTRRHY